MAKLGIEFVQLQWLSRPSIWLQYSTIEFVEING
jgi:hypothetical protein